MQLLFERSAEGEGDGIGVIEGDVIRLRANRLPQMGWNSIDERRDPLFLRSGLCDGYYANSFVCQPRDSAVVVARSTHEAHTFVAAVRMGPCIGVQFHPEKSGQPGLRFVQQWVHEARLATGMTIRETRT
jgi:glutamine amidotransferase